MLPPTDQRGIGTRTIEEQAHFQKSPFMHGLISGSKGALIAGPIAAAIQAMRGKDPIVGGILAALAGGAAMGISRYVDQDISNQETEAQMRYHVERLKGREPMLFLPPPQQFGRLFSRLHSAEHLRMMGRNADPTE